MMGLRQKLQVVVYILLKVVHLMNPDDTGESILGNKFFTSLSEY